jgi:hypothetical protein
MRRPPVWQWDDPAVKKQRKVLIRSVQHPSSRRDVGSEFSIGAEAS